MRFKGIVLLAAVLSATPLVCKADPFGAASAYNMIALGTVDAHGNTVLAGNISGNRPDVTGRIAAAGTVSASNGMTVGSNFNGDPYGSSSNYAVVAGGGVTSGSTLYINGGGKGSPNAYAPGTSGTLYFNDGGHRVTGSNGETSGLDFNSLRTSLDNESKFLGTLGMTGKIWQPETGAPAQNQDWLVLQGITTPGQTCPCIFVFNITQAEFNSGHAIDIEVPVGSTAIVNVSGTDPSLGSNIFYNGQQHTSTDTADDKILFNFPDATDLTVNPELGASILAPYAYLSGSGALDGNIIAAQIGSTGEVHNDEFTGDLPPMPPPASPVPEPGTLALVGTGIISVAGAIRRKKKVSPLT